MSEQPTKLTPYWQRIVGAAQAIIERKIADMEAETCDPAWCLLAEDAAYMEERQMDLDFHRYRLEKVKQGRIVGKFWALDAVIDEKPGLLFTLK